MLKKCLFLAMIASVVAGCSEDECSTKDMAHCSADGRAILICHNGEWKPTYCGALSCGYLDGALQCMDTPSKTCTVGDSKCSGGLVQSCGPDGVWHFETCGNSQTCMNGGCVNVQTPPADPIPQPPAAHNGLVQRRCSADASAIEYVDGKGSVTSKSCVEEVGFAAKCQTFGNGHVGCALPDSCDENFPAGGRCHGNRIYTCNEQLINPKPLILDCEAVGSVCREIDGKAGCYAACEGTGTPACSEDGGVEIVSQCIDSLMHTGASICRDAASVVSCRDGEVVETSCGDNQFCSEGVCVEKCSQNELNAVKCSESGQFLQCRAVGGDFRYVSEGRRHCLGDMLVRCELNEATGAFDLKEADCAAYEKDGEIIAGRCVLNYQYYDDMDMCIAGIEGEPCGALSENGICAGSVLKYCDSSYQIAESYDCSTEGAACSVYAGYADCRSHCSAAGTASCSYDQFSETWNLSLCVPSENDGSLTTVEGTSICLGDELYQCNDSGKTIVTNCALTGGLCIASQCVYPACRLNDSPMCFSDDAIEACLVSPDGVTLGSGFQSMVCNPDGACYACSGGNVVNM